MVPSILSHYYARERGPFRSLSDLPHAEAESVLEAIRQRGDGFASQRRPDYLVIRRELEALVRQRFIDKGGRPVRSTPRYMILGQCDWVRDWYLEGCSLAVPLARFDPRIVSFTYGDSFPAMRHNDGKPHRGQVFTLGELPWLVEQFGLPQQRAETTGPDRYIEAQVWDDEPLGEWLG
ncbi:hypothetical protein LJR016_001014 [Devosia sp. LjRoot16]|uniref:hypothetical protein n=1 Tax=Devosia sp. LjRoot16 TaxID=3342271 RepID=UPI003ECC9EB1